MAYVINDDCISCGACAAEADVLKEDSRKYLTYPER